MWMKDSYVPVECSTLSSIHVLKQHERSHTADHLPAQHARRHFTPSNGSWVHGLSDGSFVWIQE